ncbi:MAG: TIGR02466 family protein [Synechococcus lacustris]
MKPELLFPTPLWSFQCEDSALIIAALARVLSLREEDPVGLSITNVGGWHSANNLLDEPLLAPLFRWIAACCQGAFAELGWDFRLASPSFNNAWAMVNGPGDCTRAHLHPNSLFSGVIYLQATEGAGSIAFLDPRSGAQMLHPPLTEASAEWLSGRLSRQPAVGRMLLFPSWIWHEVEPSADHAERVCIAFNVGMKRQGGDAMQIDGGI